MLSVYDSFWNKARKEQEREMADLFFLAFAKGRVRGYGQSQEKALNSPHSKALDSKFMSTCLTVLKNI